MLVLSQDLDGFTELTFVIFTEFKHKFKLKTFTPKKIFWVYFVNRIYYEKIYLQL